MYVDRWKTENGVEDSKIETKTLSLIVFCVCLCKSVCHIQIRGSQVALRRIRESVLYTQLYSLFVFSSSSSYSSSFCLLLRHVFSTSSFSSLFFRSSSSHSMRFLSLIHIFVFLFLARVILLRPVLLHPLLHVRHVFLLLSLLRYFLFFFLFDVFSFLVIFVILFFVLILLLRCYPS